MPRVVNLAASALAVPSSGWGGRDAYPDLAQKAGLLAARLTKNHPLPDGNKRVAWLAMIEFVERNDHRLVQPDVDDAVGRAIGIRQDSLPGVTIAAWKTSLRFAFDWHLALTDSS